MCMCFVIHVYIELRNSKYCNNPAIRNLCFSLFVRVCLSYFYDIAKGMNKGMVWEGGLVFRYIYKGVYI